MTTVSEKDKKYATQAPPPIHSILTILCVIALCVPAFPSFEEIDEVATIDTFTSRVFPDLVSLELLVYTRVAFCLLVFSVTFFSAIPGNGWQQLTSYLPGSKLRKTQIMMDGARTLLPYTSWCWNLLGISFALNAIIAHQGGLNGVDLPQPLLRAALLIFEIAAPSTLLVSFVVTYAIWPNILRQGGSTKDIKSTRTLIWHNANVIMALTEIALLGGIPVKLGHCAVAPMFGIAYIIMTWSIVNYWKPAEGPQFIYFFFDTTLGKTTTYVLLILLTVMMFFYGIFAMVDLLIHHIGGGIISHLLFVVIVSAGVCRFRD